MSDTRTWASMGFVKGTTIREAVENSGHEYVSHTESDSGFIDIQTTTDTLQALVCSGDRFLLFRLVKKPEERIDNYVPSGKRPRKPRADAGKPRKEKVPAFTVVGQLNLEGLESE
jgi:hypothetical protein